MGHPSQQYLQAVHGISFFIPSAAFRMIASSSAVSGSSCSKVGVNGQKVLIKTAVEL